MGAGDPDERGHDGKQHNPGAPIHADGLLPLWNDDDVSAVDDEMSAHCIETPPQIQGIHLFTTLVVSAPNSNSGFLAI